MARYYPSEPIKPCIRKKYSSSDSLLVSIMIAMLSILLSFVVLILLGVPPSETGTVLTAVFSAAAGGFVFTFLKFRFSHIPRRIKAHFAYMKDMKEYNRVVNDEKLRDERSESEAFIKLVKYGTVTRRSYEP